MQHELRELLERKVAMGPGHGSGYYFDMNDDDIDYDLQAGELMAGGKRRKKAKKMTPMQRKMAHVRSYKGKGGDYIDLNNYSYYQGGAGKNTRRKRIAKNTGFKNPIQKAEKDYYNEQKKAEWLISSGPEYAARLQRKAAMINRALRSTGMAPVGINYNRAYREQLGRMNAWQPYAKAARKQGFKPTAPVGAADADLQAAIQAVREHLPGALNANFEIPAYEANNPATWAYY